MARVANELNSGATDEFSESKRRTNLRIGAADTRSNSGPSGATFLLSSFPTNPLTREVISQGETRDELLKNIREVIEMCLEEIQEETQTQFVGIQKISV